jgi:hypothetical protein
MPDDPQNKLPSVDSPRIDGSRAPKAMPPIRRADYRPPRKPKNDTTAIVMASLSMAVILIAFAFAYWWLKR